MTCCKAPYKLIFVDLNMPIMDGYKMMDAIKNVKINNMNGNES
jgi:CheY-like chemotaxis protein